MYENKEDCHLDSFGTIDQGSIVSLSSMVASNHSILPWIAANVSLKTSKL